MVPNNLKGLERIKNQAVHDSQASTYLQELIDGIGPRLTGSPEAAKAGSWALERMRRIGLSNVHAEEWTLDRGWQRGFARARLLRPSGLELNISSYGWAGSTPSGGVEAEVVPVDNDNIPEEIQKNAKGWRDKVLLLEPGKAEHPIRDYSELTLLVTAATAAHAVAIIARDQRPGVMLTHTKPVALPPSIASVVDDIPVVDIAAEHQAVLERALKAGRSPRIHIEVSNHVSQGPVKAANIIGEIPGSEQRSQIVVVAAHLDSWDLGSGAIDDGFGVAAVLDAARLILALELKPLRTIRFILFTGEEQGLLGSRAYLASHQAELPNHVCALVMDWGQGPITAIHLAGRQELVPSFQRFVSSMTDWSTVKVDKDYLHFTDAFSFTVAGIPGIALGQDSPNLTLQGHSAADTLDKIDPTVLAKNAGFLALIAASAATDPERLGVRWPPDKTAQVLIDDKERIMLQLAGQWLLPQ
ncbi:MAG: M20/M25/M40 family metallo-hydrolase [Candidatus Angelobacter sp.]